MSTQSQDREFRRIVDEMVKRELARREKAAKAKAAKAKGKIHTPAQPSENEGASGGGGTRAVLAQVRFGHFSLVTPGFLGGRRLRHIVQSIEFAGEGVAPSGLGSIAPGQFRDRPGTKGSKDGILRFKNGEIDAPPETPAAST